MNLHGFSVLLLVFAATVGFVLVGARIFIRGWESYEKRYVASTERSLDGIYLILTPQQIVYLSLFSSLMVWIAGTIIFENLLYPAPLALPAFFVPRLVIFMLKRNRDKRFSMQLVDALVMMGNSLKAGLSLQQALQIVPREMDNPIKQEFRIAMQEIQLGLTEEHALANLRDRMPTEDVDLFVTAVNISRDVGGNLAEVFDNIAETIRERFRIEGRIRALTAQGKAQGIVMCILPVVAAILINVVCPGWMKPMFNTIWGWGMMGGVVVMEALGAFFIWRIVSIDV
jgi:tight adherence protein B